MRCVYSAGGARQKASSENNISYSINIVVPLAICSLLVVRALRVFCFSVSAAVVRYSCELLIKKQ